MIAAAFIVPHPPLIVPQVGRGGEKQVAKTIASYEETADEIAALKPDTIIISSPHSVMYGDYFHISPRKGAKGSFSQFGAPDVSFDMEYDTELVKDITLICGERGVPAGTFGAFTAIFLQSALEWVLKQQINFISLVTVFAIVSFLNKHYRELIEMDEKQPAAVPAEEPPPPALPKIHEPDDLPAN